MNKQNLVCLGCFGCVVPCLIAVLLAGLWLHNLSIALGGSDDDRPHHPNSEMLQSNFVAHQSEFEALRRLASADAERSECVNLHRWKDLKPPFCIEDLSNPPLADSAEYQKPFQELDLIVIAARRKEVIELTASSWGNLAESSSCGYTYSPIELTTHEEGDAANGTRTIFTPLKNHWYLFFRENW